MTRAFFFLIIFSTCSVSINCQTDNILWAGVKVQKPLSDKWGLALLPYMRYNEDLSAYQNTSVDYSVRYNFSSQWYLQLLGRTWLIPEDPNRQFVWVDIAYIESLPTLSLRWTNRLRWHQALDINNSVDPDYIRYWSQLRLLNKGKIHPLFGIEIWMRTKDTPDLSRIRIEPGLRYDVSPDINLLLMLRRQNFINIEKPRGDNLWVLLLTFDI